MLHGLNVLINATAASWNYLRNKVESASVVESQHDPLSNVCTKCSITEQPETGTLSY
ncbi:hypothetical protein HUJ05_010706 [Dendroctonus ponderosae]|nr:hypothetical protein HUJ05_010706 [Dendroctonus ponderosae]